MGSHIDPRLYGPVQQPPPPYDVNGPRLPPIHHHHHHQQSPEAPSISSSQSLQQSGPYYGQAVHLQQVSAPVSSSPTVEQSQIQQEAARPPSSPSNDGQAEAQDPKRSRACEACRGLKVKCDQEHPDQPCKRCAKAKRPCIVTAPNRRRQKKTDSRVAELEKKIDALTASLQAKENVPNDGSLRREDANNRSYTSNAYDTPPSERPLSAGGQLSDPNNKSARSGRRAGQKRSYDEHVNESPRMNSGTRSGTAVSYETVDYDQIDAQIDQIIDRRDASKVFDYYISDMVPNFPAVAFPPGTRAEDVREKQPILFLSILVTASVGLTDTNAGQHLARFCLGVFADSIIRNGDKSLELIQALMVSTIWYRPPSRYEQMNFYQLTHIAAVMAIELGIGKPIPQALRYTTANEQGQFHKAKIRADLIEARRTWLGCYFLCANVSMALRRPNLIRWTKYMDECISILENSPDALPSDKLFCQHVKLQHINEEIGLRFQMEDPLAQVEFTSASTRQTLLELEGRLRSWNHSVPPTVYNLALHYNERVSNLYMHEIAMHINHNIEDYKSPFTEESLKAASALSHVLSSDHSLALKECLKSVHAIFEDFFKFEISTLRALPIFYFIRVAYAVVCLIKLYFAVSAPGSEVSKIITKETLNVEPLVDRLLHILHTIDDEGVFRPATRFLFILERVRDWFRINKNNHEAPVADRSKFAADAQQVAQDALDSGRRRHRSETSAESSNSETPVQSSQGPHDAKRARYSTTQPSPLETLSHVAASQSDPRRLSNSMPTYNHQAGSGYAPSSNPDQANQQHGSLYYQRNTSVGTNLFAQGDFTNNVFGFDQAFGMALGNEDFMMNALPASNAEAETSASGGGGGSGEYRGW